MATKYEFKSRALVLTNAGDKLGEFPISEAKKMAAEQGLDLVEVARQDNLSVCKIMDEGKWKYEQKKRARKQKQNQHQPAIKQVKFTLRIEEHDENVKVEQIEKFLSKGDMVQVMLLMKGREKGKLSLAEEKMDEILSKVTDRRSDTKIEHQKGSHGSLTVLLRP